MHVEIETSSQSPCISSLPNTDPFQVHPTMRGCVQLHLIDGHNGFECIADLAPAQIDNLITQLTTARAYEEAN